MIYTIGHSNRSAQEFIGLLRQYGIKYLVDVRSQPYSKYNKQYNQVELKAYLGQQGVTYVFMGDELGGRPTNASCYTPEGKLDYNLVKQTEFFKHGIERLIMASTKGLPVAIMCSEAKPQECHRGLLISPALKQAGVDVVHINEKGQLAGFDEVTQLIAQRKGLFD